MYIFKACLHIQCKIEYFPTGTGPAAKCTPAGKGALCIVPFGATQSNHCYSYLSFSNQKCKQDYYKSLTDCDFPPQQFSASSFITLRTPRSFDTLSRSRTRRDWMNFGCRSITIEEVFTSDVNSKSSQGRRVATLPHLRMMQTPTDCNCASLWNI